MKIKLIILFLLSSLTNAIAQAKQTNLQKFEAGIFTQLNNEVGYKGFDFEGFTICIKVNGKGKIDATLISLSAMPETRERLNKIRSSFNYQSLLAEIKVRQWKSVNILLPVLILYDSRSAHKGLQELGNYASGRLDYFSEFSPISTDDYLSNCIVLKTLTIVKSEAVR